MNSSSENDSDPGAAAQSKLEGRHYAGGSTSRNWSLDSEKKQQVPFRVTLNGGVESRGDSSSGVGRPPALAERIEAEPPDQIGACVKPVSPDTGSEHETGAHVKSRRNAQAQAGVDSSLLRENSVDARLGLDLLFRSLR